MLQPTALAQHRNNYSPNACSAAATKCEFDCWDSVFERVELWLSNTGGALPAAQAVGDTRAGQILEYVLEYSSTRVLGYSSKSNLSVVLGSIMLL